MTERAPMPRLAARDAAREVALRLARAGFEAYFAGGCVRDFLRGEMPEDYDIATSATPEQIQGVFPKARGVGEAFGVMLVRHAGHQFEVATFREDGPYRDGRRPSEVRFSTAERDAHRRDFTVNGLFQRPDDDAVVDFVEGRADLERRVIRAIRDAHERIREDRLRMLRAVRFAARLGYAIAPETAAAIRAHATELASVSAERVGEELRKMLAHPARARAAALADELSLDGAVFGRMAPIGAHPRLSSLPEGASWTTALAAWWLDREAGGRTETVRPDAAAIESAVATLRARLVLSNHETDALAAVLATREHLLGSFADAAPAARARAVARPGFDGALDLLLGDQPAQSAAWRSVADRELPGRRLPAPIVDGAMLVALGLRPGPRFKVLLDAALDAQLEGRLRSEADGRAFIAAQLAQEA